MRQRINARNQILFLVAILCPTYETTSLREYAALTNYPILYCLNYLRHTHRIGLMWAYVWLIDFVKSAKEVVAFHPEALRLVKENLPNWKNPFASKNDYQLFLEGVFPDPMEGDRLVIEAIRNNKVLYKDKTSDRWFSK